MPTHPPPHAPGIHAMKRHAGTFSIQQYTWLQSQSDRYGISLSEILRRVVDGARDVGDREMESANRP